MIWSSELAEGNVGRLQFQQGLPNRPSYCARPLSVRDLVKKGRTALLPLNLTLSKLGQMRQTHAVVWRTNQNAPLRTATSYFE